MVVETAGFLLLVHMVEVLAGAAGMHVPLARPPSVHNISRVTSVAEAEALPGVMFLMRPGKTLTSPPSMLPSPI